MEMLLKPQDGADSDSLPGSFESRRREYGRSIFVGMKDAQAAPIAEKEHANANPPAIREAARRKPDAKTRRRKSPRALFIMTNMLFYLAILMILLSLLPSGAMAVTARPRMFLGYACFNVISSSMQNELPKGSLIVVRETDARGLKVGDNITFMRGPGSSVTHQIVAIEENCLGSGSRGFQTKGVNNLNPDRDIVHGTEIVGKVVFSVPAVGAAVAYLGEHVYLALIAILLCLLICLALCGRFESPAGKSAAKPARA